MTTASVRGQRLPEYEIQISSNTLIDELKIEQPWWKKNWQFFK